MVTDNGRVLKQFWADVKADTFERAKKMADEKRMRFSGFVGLAIEKYVEDLEKENDKL